MGCDNACSWHPVSGVVLLQAQLMRGPVVLGMIWQCTNEPGVIPTLHYVPAIGQGSNALLKVCLIPMTSVDRIVWEK